MNAKQVADAIKKRFSNDRQYAVVEEVGITTGGACRRLDMIVIDCYWSNSFRIDGFEIKVSTSDLRRELADPAKHTIFYDVLDFYTLACPKGVAEPLMDVIPKKWGILIVNEDGTTRYKRKPLSLVDDTFRDVPRYFLASLTRAIQAKQPYAAELREAYQKGYDKGKENGERQFDYMKGAVRHDYAKIEAYDKMMTRFRIWSFGKSVDKIMDEFEAFRKLKLDDVKNTVQDTQRDLGKIAELLESVVKSREGT